MKQYEIYVGGYGSGKTELSLNAAVGWARQGRRVALVDLDIVNPYFRSMEHADMLRAEGVRVLGPTFANTTLDVPSLPAEIYSVFDTDEDVIFDVGGDPVGAAALGRFAKLLGDAPVYMVVNVRRPLTGTPQDIAEMARTIQLRSHLPLRGLINNANMGPETAATDLIEGQGILRQAGEMLNLPVVRVTGLPGVLAGLPEELRALATPLGLCTRPDWL